ncbi:HDOD domain-containing protein [Catenovulum sp. SM1970]|uniref:HDOD domain-containing protein n=1 Tax=Marinifaba aquimaris TaxID=2741323 RepID=UPI001572BFD4|nr:HDOD domain-containing protein [Marinifaba aquimaris]NTS75984.1 HDOD domain-containing protein [Marinifaba aquimaris]
MARPLNMADVDKALDGFTIPPRPKLLIALQAELESAEPNIHNISNLINQDVGVAGFTLKVVNSAVFGLSSKVSSVEHACNFLGIDKVVKLVRSILLRYTLSQSPEDDFLTSLWSSSELIANTCSALASYFDIEESDDAFTLGMFHNAGMALIYMQNDDYPQVVEQSYRQNTSSIGEFEEASFESSHEVLGFLISQNWGLSALLSNVIAYHHSSSVILTTGSFDEKQLFCVLKLAEHMTSLSKILGQSEIDHEWEKNKQIILDILEIEEYQLDDLGEVLFGYGIDTLYHKS